MPNPKLAIVIPTLHEAANIKIVLDRLRESLDPLQIPYELIVVDDDSRDGIETIVNGISQTDPRIKLLVRKGQRGLAGAVIHGWAATSAEVLGVIDADLQHPPELLPRLWQALQSGADAAVASRYAPQGSLENWSKWRHLISQVSIWMTLPLQRPGIRVMDPMAGYFLVRRSCIDGIQLQKQGFKILLEILVRGRLKSVVEVPFEFGHRYAGHSKAGLKVAVDYVALLAKLWWKR
jgi:dolichol-phosphate mannosyltransferase